MILWRPKAQRQARIRAIRKDFVRRYNKDKLRERKFNEQSGLCAVCKLPLTDSSGLFTHLDHAIPVYLYATWGYPINVAAQHANNEKNIVAVHHTCNLGKGEQDLEELLEQMAAGKTVPSPRAFTPEMLAAIKQERLVTAKARQERSNRNNRTARKRSIAIKQAWAKPKMRRERVAATKRGWVKRKAKLERGPAGQTLGEMRKHRWN